MPPSDGEATRRGPKEKDQGGKGEKEDEEKVIFIHYDQRKVMLSQLHPIENGVPDPKADPASELRQVRQQLARFFHPR